MDQWWNKLPLFVVFLLLGNASGFKGGAYSNAHHQWGQPSDNTFSPRAVQSSVSEVPVSGILPEVGSSLFTNRPLKSLNFLKFVKGGVSNRLELTSYAQTAPSSSILASLPLPLNEQLAGSLTLLHGSSGSTITDTASVSSQGESTSFPAVLGTSGLSTSNQSSPSLYMSSSQETSGAKSIEANLPVFSQGSVLYNSSSASGATYNSQGSPVPLSEGSGQSISPQGESHYSGSSQYQGASDTLDSYNKLSSSSVSSQSTSDQSTPSLYSLSSQSSSGSLLEASGSSFQVDLSPQSQEPSNQILPSPLEVSSQSSNGQSTPSLFMVKTDSPSTDPASPPDTQSSLSQSILSTLTQGSASTSQGSSGPELSGSSGQLIPKQVESGSYRGVSQSLSTSSRHAPGSLMYRNFGALPVGVSTQYTSVQSSPSVSTSTQSRSGTQLMTSSNFFPVKGDSHSTSTLSLKPQGIVGMYAPASSAYTGFASQGMSSTYSGSVQPQGTTSQFASGSPSSYPSASLSSPLVATGQSAAVQSSRKQFTSSYGTLSGSSTPFSLQGSTTYGGSLQPQGTTSQFASGPSSYPSAVQSSRKQFTSSYGTVSGFSTPFSLQGSNTYGGLLQPQVTTSQFASGPSSYPSASLSSPLVAAGQSAAVQSSRKQFTSSYGTLSGSSTPFSLQGSTTYGGSLQPQGTTSQFASGSSSYPSASSSPQVVAGQSAAVQSSQKQFTSPFTGSTGTPEGSSTPFNLHGSTFYGGSLKPQATTGQFASGSPSSYPSLSPSSAQGVAGQSAAAVQSSRKQFTSSYGTLSGFSTPFSLQGSNTYGGLLQPQVTTSQFASGPLSYPSAVQSSRKQFTSSYGTLSGFSTPFSLQGSNTYGGLLQPQVTTSQFASGPSSYPSASLSSPLVAAGQSAAVQSSRKQFTSSYGTLSGSSTPFSLQGSTTYGGSLQPQGTTSQFASGSPSSYPSLSPFSPQGAAGLSAAVQSSRKQFTSSYGTVSGSSTPFNLQGSTIYGGSLKPQGTTSQFASGYSSYPSLSPSSLQGVAGQSAAVQSSRKQFTSSYGTLSGSSTPLSLQGSTTYGGSLQPQHTTSQFASGSSSYPSASSSPQVVAGQSATVQSSQKQFTSPFTGSTGTPEGSSTPFNLHGSTFYGGSLKPQATTGQFASGSPSSYPSLSPSSAQGVAGQSAAVQSSRKQFTSSYGTLSGFSTPFSLQGSNTYGGLLQPQVTTSQFASGSPSSYPSLSPFSPQGAAGLSAAVQSSRKQSTSSYGTVSGSSTPFNLQGSTIYGGSLKPQGTTSQFASGYSSYPSASPSSPQVAASQSAAVQSSQKQYTSSYGTMSGSSTPFSLEGSTTYGGSPKPQATTSQFAPASPSSYNCHCASLSSPQDVASVSATVQSLQKQFTSSYGSHSQSGSSTPFSLQGSTTYGGSLQPQATTSQFVPASPSYNCHCVSLSSPQDVASQSNQASQSQKSQRWKLSEGIQTSGAVASQGSALSQSSPMQSRFSSLSSAGGSSGDSGQFVSAQDGSTSYGGLSLLSQSLSSKYTPVSHAYAKLGSSPLSVSSQSTSNPRSNGLYSSDSLRPLGVVKRLSSQAPSDSPISKKISERFVTLQRLTGSSRAPFLGLSSQASSVGMFSGIPQTAQALRESGSDVQLYNQLFLKPLLLRQGLRDSTKTAS